MKRIIAAVLASITIGVIATAVDAWANTTPTEPWATPISRPGQPEIDYPATTTSTSTTTTTIVATETMPPPRFAG